MILAPFMEKDRLVGIFGHDMLDDASQIDGFRELLGLKVHKPWECVGEILESGAAFNAIAGRDEWANTAVIKSLAGEMSGGDDELLAAFNAALTPDNADNIPARFKGAFDNEVK